jgi:hypothetical protein
VEGRSCQSATPPDQVNGALTYREPGRRFWSVAAVRYQENGITSSWKQPGRGTMPAPVFGVDGEFMRSVDRHLTARVENVGNVPTRKPKPLILPPPRQAAAFGWTSQF